MGGFTNFNLQPYQGPWTYTHAAHLLRRTTYGPIDSDIEQAVEIGLHKTLQILLEDKPLPENPVNYNYENDPLVPIGSTWVDKPFSRVDKFNQLISSRLRSIAAWTMGLQLEEGISIREKMVLFWHNHFVVSEIRDANFLYRNLQLYRKNFLGNFRELTKATNIDPAMLRYLNGNQNTRQRPNENYARELLELFTIGKGPQVGDGDYTHYTEHDIAEISRVLTGWTDTGYLSRNDEPIGVRFRSNRHDTSTKKLSARFDFAEIPNLDEAEHEYLIDIIFMQQEVSRFIARKIYRWFVYYEIDEQVEQQIIQPMAEILRSSDYEMRPMIEALLSSEHFYDAYAIGSMIKNPIDFIATSIRELNVDLGSELFEKYTLWLRLAGFSDLLQMGYFNPPSVAGWKAYYQEPSYYRTWINSTTISSRFMFSNLLLNGVNVERIRLQADLLGYLEGMETPQDPNALIDNMAARLLPKPITPTQHDYLKSVLIPGLPDYEWTLEYDLYRSNPEDKDLRRSLENRLKSMVLALTSLPEYQLS